MDNRNEIIQEAVTVEAALDAISAELDVPISEIEYDVLVEPTKKLFGMGTERNAQVKGWVRLTDTIDEARALAQEVLEIEDKKEIPLDIEDDDSEEEITEEQLDLVADTATEILKSVLGAFELGKFEIEEYEGDEGEIILDVVGEDLAVLIGRYGRTLESIQMLVAMATTRRLEFRYPVTIDVEGYKNRRRQKIESIARSAAARSVRQNSAVRLQPMNPYERRIVHLALRENTQIITQSEGSDPNRIVVVRPKR